VGGITDVFLQNIVPILLVASIGVVLRWKLKVDGRPLARVVFNGLSPCLVFVSLVNSELSGDEFARLFLYTVGMVAITGVLAWLTGRFLRFGPRRQAALMLTVMFVNSGNYGLTLAELRYGAPGLSRAIVYYVTSTSLVYTVGVFLATMGQRPDWRGSLRRLARIPAVYATLVAILFFVNDWTVPRPLMSGIEIAAGGAIPVMLVILGINLASITEPGILRRSLGLVVPGSILRMVVAPAVGLGLATALGLTGVSRSMAVIDAALPAAVITTVIATEFDVEPTGVTATVIVTTLLSPITVPIIVTLFNL